MPHRISVMYITGNQWVANRLSIKRSNRKADFRIQAFGNSGTFINSATLIIISVVIIVKAVQTVNLSLRSFSNLMIWLAFASIIVNRFNKERFLVHQESDSHGNMEYKVSISSSFSVTCSTSVLRCAAGGLANQNNLALVLGRTATSTKTEHWVNFQLQLQIAFSKNVLCFGLSLESTWNIMSSLEIHHAGSLPKILILKKSHARYERFGS